MTLPELQALREQIIAKIAAGEKSVHFSDRGIENQTAGDLLKTLEYLDGQIAAASGTQPSGRVTSFASHSRE